MEKKNQRYKKCCTKEKRNANRKVLQLRLSRRQVVVESGLVWRHVLASQVSIWILILNATIFPSIYSASAASVARWHSGSQWHEKQVN